MASSYTLKNNLNNLRLFGEGFPSLDTAAVAILNGREVDAKTLGEAVRYFRDRSLYIINRCAAVTDETLAMIASGEAPPDEARSVADTIDAIAADIIATSSNVRGVTLSLRVKFMRLFSRKLRADLSVIEQLCAEIDYLHSEISDSADSVRAYAAIYDKDNPVVMVDGRPATTEEFFKLVGV